MPGRRPRLVGEWARMKYLVLSIDPFGIPLRMKGEPPSTRWPVELTEDLMGRLLDWNDRFSDVFAAEDRYTAEQRASLTSQLNAEGRKLAEMIDLATAGNAKTEFLPE